MVRRGEHEDTSLIDLSKGKIVLSKGFAKFLRPIMETPLPLYIPIPLNRPAWRHKFDIPRQLPPIYSPKILRTCRERHHWDVLRAPISDARTELARVCNLAIYLHSE